MKTKENVERRKRLQKWEYRVVDLVKETEKRRAETDYWLRATDLEEILNTLGAQGWELVDVHFIHYKEEAVVVGFFKRLL